MLEGRELNAAQCLDCLDVIESKHVHDYVRCNCGNVAVDGGRDYIRRGFRDESKIREILTRDEFDRLKTRDKL